MMNPPILLAARVIVCDPRDRALLLGFSLDADPTRVLWVPPGGSVEKGETLLAAAVRELYEETGLVVDERDLEGPVAECRKSVEDDGTPCDYRHSYWFHRSGSFEADTSGLHGPEHDDFVGWRWWSVDEIESASSPDIVVPVGLAGLTRRLLTGERPRPPVSLPWE